MFKNKVWCPVSRKIRRYFHFLLSLAYPIDRLDWALFSVVILFRHWFPLLEKAEIQALILPRNLPAVLIIFMGRGVDLWYLDGVPHICFQVWFCRRSACANIRCMMGWRTRTLKNCLSPRIQALRDIKLHWRQDLLLTTFPRELTSVGRRRWFAGWSKIPYLATFFLTSPTD